MPLIIIVLAAFGLVLVAHLVLREKPTGDLIGVSHRGAAGLAPENTLAAVRAGIAHDMQVIEIDIHQTADGALVVMHDPTVDRTTNGSGAIRDLTLAQVQDLDAGSWFGPAFAGEPVPTLDAVLDTVAEAEGVTLYIEVKNPDRYQSLTETLVETLKARAGQPPVVVVSFDIDWLVRFHQLAPRVPIGALGVISTTSTSVPGVQMASVHWSGVLLDPTLIARVHRRGWRLVVWTVDQPWLMRLVLWLGVDGVTTNQPEQWQAVRGG